MRFTKEDMDFVYELALGYAQGLGHDNETAKQHAEAAVKRAWESK